MAELDVRTAQEQARKMHAYVDSFNGQTFSPALDSVDRQNLAVALDNLLETAAMLGNVSDRLSCASGKAEPAIWANFPCYLIDHCEGDTINEEGLQRALSDMLADPKYATPPAALTSAPAEPLTDSYVQQVPDKCDRIVWRGNYHHLPLAPAQTPQAAALPDPLGCNACTHPDCGRFNGPRGVECRAMADNACARKDSQAAGAIDAREQEASADRFEEWFDHQYLGLDKWIAHRIEANGGGSVTVKSVAREAYQFALASREEAPPAAGAAQAVAERFCNKCGYFGPDQWHWRPNGSGECGYLSMPTRAATPAPEADETASKMEVDAWRRALLVWRDAGISELIEDRAGLKQCLSNAARLLLDHPALKAAHSGERKDGNE